MLDDLPFLIQPGTLSQPWDIFLNGDQLVDINNTRGLGLMAEPISSVFCLLTLIHAFYRHLKPSMVMKQDSLTIKAFNQRGDANCTFKIE